MINKTEAEERKYLETVRAKLESALERIDAEVTRYARDIRQQKTHLWENKTGMDAAEKVALRQAVNRDVSIGEAAAAKKRRIQKLLRSPYFGRIDFIEQGSGGERLPLYIGIHSHFDSGDHSILVYDWRAPISTMFYDYEMGEAHYESPRGRISGEILTKRQYRIRDGKMQFMLESSLNIHDDVLQKELSAASDDKMKNIVATIQRDQNAIIRNEKSQVLIIQGVAGSGKTSIALHRIAFLLYRFKETITSKDILIISPNKVFADYISNVLPELGEEKILETGIETLAEEMLEYQFKFQTFFEQVSLLLERDDEAFKKRIQVKASAQFLDKLNEYIRHLEATCFLAADVTVRGHRVKAHYLERCFKASRHRPLFKRFEKIADAAEHYLKIHRHYDVSRREKDMLTAAVKKMFKLGGLLEIYKDFYAWLGTPELFTFAKPSVLEYSDVFPLVYLKLRLEGVKSYDEIKHLLIDEMQDYTAVQYAVLARVFSCKKTILGDVNQSVNPFSASNSSEIQKAFAEADCVKLCKSYRSTYEITQFAQRIQPNADLVAIERRGAEPVVMRLKSGEAELEEILRCVKEFPASGFHSMGIICKTQQQAAGLHEKLHGKGHKVHLLTSQSASFSMGITVCTAHMAKGLEFDQVIVPNATDENYSNVMDKSLLYVACTRAMHRLTITCVNRMTAFIRPRES